MPEPEFRPCDVTRALQAAGMCAYDVTRAFPGPPRLGRQPVRLRHWLCPRPPQRLERVVHRDAAPPEVPQRKPVARGLGPRPAPLHLAQVPVQPLVAVDEADDVSPAAEADLLRQPGEPHPAARLAPCADINQLVERPERLWHPHDDPTEIELTQARKMRPRPGPEGLDHH